MEIFENKTAIVTGAGSGLGRSLAHELAKAGARVVITDVVQDRIEQVVAELKDMGAEAKGYQVDHSKLDRVQEFADKFFTEWNHVDILCLNAGVALGGVIEELKIQDWEWILGVNLWGAIYMVHVFVPKMIERKQGRILITASAAGLCAFPGLVPYCTTKFGAVGLAQALRVELIKHDIRVTVLCPGGMKTNIAKDAKIYMLDEKGESRKPKIDEMFDKIAKDPSAVARAGLKGLARDTGIVVSPAWQILPMWLMNRLSPSMYQAVARMVWKKGLVM